MGTCASGGATLCTGAAAACLDLTSDLSNYIASIPVDLSDGSAATTAYSVQVVAISNVVTIYACSAEGSKISVSR